MKQHRVKQRFARPGVGSATAARHSRVCSVAILLLLLVFNAACVRSMARSAGQGVVEGARREVQTDSTQEALQSTANSAIAYVDSAFRADLEPTLKAAVDRLGSRFEATLDSGEAMLLRAEDSLAVALGGPLSDALVELVRRNIENAGSEFRQELGLLSEHLAADIENQMTPALASAITTATTAFMSELSESVRTDLAAAMETALTNAVGKAVTAGTESADPLLLKIGLGLGGLVVLWFGLRLYRDSLRKGLKAGELYQEVTDLKQQLRKRGEAPTAERKVEPPWFQSFLKKEGYTE